MMKQKVLLILAITSVVLILSYGTIIRIRTNPKNGFERLIKPVNLTVNKVLKLPSDICFFAGESEGLLHLKNFKDYTSILNVDIRDGFSMSISDIWKIPNLPNEIMSQKAVCSSVTDSTIGIVINDSGYMFSIDKSNSNLSSGHGPRTRFDNVVFLSGKTVIGRNTVVKGEALSREYVKIDYSNGAIQKSYSLRKQADGFFCTDGKSRFNKTLSRIFYMYAYRGEVDCLDSNLNLLFTINTIDTISQVVIPLKEIRAHGKLISITPSTTPSPVNRGIEVSGKNLLLSSALKADNESDADFNNNQVVDTYSGIDGKYLFSFYIPKYRGIKLREFIIHKDQIFAIYGQYLVRFTCKDNPLY
ncbi:hypothetical protein [Parapedobacter sp. 2B3]|uniref:hypothetical protein n=1 Tax=Parapedobacter sp. 2B3 TaxID=3342381 RepID=UPI0035B602E2